MESNIGTELREMLDYREERPLAELDIGKIDINQTATFLEDKAQGTVSSFLERKIVNAQKIKYIEMLKDLLETKI